MNRPGAVCLLFAALVVSCDRAADNDEGPRVLELTHDTIRLEAGVRLAGIEVRREASGEFHPAATEVRQGDVVRFTAGDGGGHAIAFGGQLDPAILEFLERTGQLRSPPLIAQGSSWVITLDGAPAGEYPFRCTTHNVAGRLTVAPR
ncbi:hypothetical protein BH23GEM9_BH23GEM9_01600 [soil metagenome]